MKFMLYILPIVVIWLRIWGACSVISAFIAFDIIEIKDPKNDKPENISDNYGGILLYNKMLVEETVHVHRYA